MSLDLRTGYRFRLPRGQTLDAFLDIFNATNEPNFDNPTPTNNSSDRRNPSTFLNLTEIFNGGPTRTAQINVRFGF
jgi:hypothetical protein